VRTQLAGAIALLLCGASGASAGVVGFNGSFGADDDVHLFHFSVQNTALVTVETTSYALGGFQTILSLFDADGNFQFDHSGYSTADDAFFIWNAIAGVQYNVALTQYDNYAVQPNLSDGFVRQGTGNFTAELPFNNPMPGARFLLPGGEQRTGNWTVQFSSDEDSLAADQVPEPATLFLGASALAAILIGRRCQ
jgi:hypothetical protein